MKPADDDREAWELLGLTPGASIDEIRRAYQHLARALAPGSLSVYSVLDPHEQHDLQRRLHAAYRRLLVQSGGEADEPTVEPLAAAPAKTGTTRLRRRPGRERPAAAVGAAAPTETVSAPFGEPAAAGTPPPVDAPEPAARPPLVAEGGSEPAADTQAEVGGAGLAARRAAAGISIADMSRRTRIRGAVIAAVEAEAWGELPPRVYLRGFVLSLARELKLDGERVWHDYERRWRAATGGEPE